MKFLSLSELKAISGGYNIGELVVNVSSEGIPSEIFSKIELSRQNMFDGVWDYNYSIVYLCANGCMPYYGLYKENEWTALWNSGYFNKHLV